jgi:hypothetical protein
MSAIRQINTQALSKDLAIKLASGTPDGKGGWKYERATGVWSKYPPKPTGDKFYEPPRSQPIEYDKPNWIVSNWWWIALGLILTALIIYLIH